MRSLLAVIGDQDTVTGLLLAGTGHITNDQRSNFLIVDSSSPGLLNIANHIEVEQSLIEKTFDNFIQREDIAILLINQHIADKIRYKVDNYTAAFPSLLEIPSKDHPYDPDKDSILKRVQKLFGKD